MCLSLKFNFHLYIRCYVYFASYGHLGYQFIDQEALLTACCLEMLLHLPKSLNWPLPTNTKICCMYDCEGLTSSRFGHIRYQLVFVVNMNQELHLSHY